MHKKVVFMLKVFSAALVLPLVLFAASCSESNDDGGNDDPVKLAPETKPVQQVYADEQQGPAPIKFTATGPWTATVAAVPTKAEGGSEVDWLKLSAYKGGAGEVSLTMELQPNLTGQDRKAEIRIACGGTVITITVEQKGTTESGEKPEDPDKPAPEPIELTGETPTQQTVWADETKTPKDIAFKTLAPWTATVAEAAVKAEGGSEVDWLTLSKYAGEAGEVSLTATLSPNYTGQDRKAEIRIVCSDKSVVLTVEQKATKADGTKPEDPNKPAGYALVESIEANFFAGCKENYNRNTAHYVFRYDDQNRIAEYEISDYDYYNGEPELDYKHTTGFDYTVPGEIRLTEKNTDIIHYSKTHTYRVQLDDQGRATQIKEDGHESDADYPETHRYAYNDEGRLSRISWYEGSNYNESYEAMTYQNGVFSKVDYYNDYGSGDAKGEIVFPADAFSDRLNDRLNIDPNWLLFTEPDEPEYMLPMLRLAGKGCDRLTLWLPSDLDDDVMVEPPHSYPEPNVTIHESYDYYTHETTGRLQYTFNEDGTIATIVQPIDCIKMRCEYDIVVGNEPFNPDYPEAGYKGTIKNETRREIGRSTDRHKWTFTYRK